MNAHIEDLHKGTRIRLWTNLGQIGTLISEPIHHKDGNWYFLVQWGKIVSTPTMVVASPLVEVETKVWRTLH